MNIEYKGVEAEVKAINDDGEGTLRFIRFHQEDKDSDITLPGFIGKQESIILPSHNWKSDYPPLGKGESFEADGSTLFHFRLNMDDPLAQRWRSWLLMDMKSGRPLQALSYGFSVHPDGMEYGQKDGKRIRFLKPRPDGSPGAKLHEVSFVVVPAGNDTAVLDLKAFQPSSTIRRSWPGGVTPMKGVKEHVSEAVTSVHQGLRHLHHVRLILAKSPAGAKTDEDFDTAMEHFESVLDMLNEAAVLPVETPPVITPPAPVPVKAAEVVPPDHTAEGAEEEPEAVVTPMSHPNEKGGMPIHDELEQVMRSIERRHRSLRASQGEAGGRKRALSERPPHVTRAIRTG